MSKDRRVHDPFAPHPPATLLGAVTPSEPDEDPTGADPVNDPDTDLADDGLDDLTKTELVDRAKLAGVATSGTKDDLIARLREAP